MRSIGASITRNRGIAGSSGDEKRNMYGAKKDGATRNKRMSEHIKSLTDEELRIGSMEKAPNKCATEFAIKCQRELYSRHH